jgi:phosphotransferase system enzyme I (PtsI)
MIKALVTRFGGPTSHTAIIARQLGIPCIVAASDLETVPRALPILVDGTSGIITLSPDAAEADELVRQDAALREEIRSWRGPAQTADGVHVQLLANVSGRRRCPQGRPRHRPKAWACSAPSCAS